MSTKYRSTKALEEFLTALKERKKDKGDEVSEILCNTALSKINKECTTLNQFIMDTGWRFVPTPEEGEPKDPEESEDKITELKDTYYRMWTKQLLDGAFDPDKSSKPDLTDTTPDPVPPAPEPKPEPENAEVEVKDTTPVKEDKAPKSAEKGDLLAEFDRYIDARVKEHTPSSGGGADDKLRADFEEFEGKVKKVLKMQAEKIKSLESALETQLLG